MERIGVRDQFGKSGVPAQLLKDYGLTAEDIVKAAEKVIAKK